MASGEMGFKDRIYKTLGEKLPYHPKLSALTGRIILTQQQYNELQNDFVHSDYNMWCAGMNKHHNPNSDPNLPFFNYIETGDAKNFSDLFITEAKAELEAKQSPTQEEKGTQN